MNRTLATNWNFTRSDAPATDGAAVRSLDTWPAQVPAVISGFASGGSESNQRTLWRLAELGFLPGETVRIVARGWLRGSPVAVRIGQSTFALRQHEAAMLRIVPTGDHP